MFHHRNGLAAAAGLVMSLIATMALADDWNVVKERGRVEAQYSGKWQPLSLGDVVPDGTPIRTAANGHVRLTRGKEWVDLSPGTLITIHDKDGRQFTTIEQLGGQVEVEAEVLNVKHFAVQTQWLAAVVKGTHFVVSVREKSASVEVDRGQVKVTNGKGLSVMVKKGQSITVDKSGRSVLTGAAAVGASASGSILGAVPIIDGAVGDAVDALNDINPCNGNSGNPNGNGLGNALCR